MLRATVIVRAAIALAGALACATPLLAQGDERDLGWAFTAEFSTVWTGGNAESNTLGLASTIRYVWPRSEARFDAGAIRTRSTLKSRTAVGTVDDFDLEEESTSETTAESYFARARYDYQVSPRLFLFGGTDWLRNTFAGIDSRLLIVLGAGNSWVERERVRFKTDYGFTYTFQEDVVENPFIKSNFPGLRYTSGLWWRLTGSTEFTSDLIADWNLDNTDDVRADLTNAIAVAISSALSLKPSLKLSWRNDPSLTEVPLLTSGGVPTGQVVLVPLENLDTFFTIALVVRI
jgi:putative salt-induced outer membrane protein YdiY